MAVGVEARIQSIAAELQALASSPAVDAGASRQLRAAVTLLEKATARTPTPSPDPSDGRTHASVHTIGIAVQDLAAAQRRFESMFDAPMVRHAVHAEEGSEWAWYQLGPIALELIAPTGPDSRVQRFLDRRGEGLFLVSLAVDDMADAIHRFRQAGLTVIHDEGQTSFPGGGVNNFVHPKSFFGTLIEFRQLDESAE